MFALSNRQQEAFCAGLARGLSPREAGEEAGYKKLDSCLALCRRPRIARRAAYLRAESAWEPTPDLSGVFTQLRAVAMAALAPDAPRTLSVARDCIELVARLKAKLPVVPSDADLAPIDDTQLTLEEWTAKYGPPAP
jgi:hypothetical protein